MTEGAAVFEALPEAEPLADDADPDADAAGEGDWAATKEADC